MPLFSLRRLDHLQKNNLETFFIENKTFQHRIIELESTLAEIKASKAWRILELMRRWKAAIKHRLFKS